VYGSGTKYLRGHGGYLKLLAMVWILPKAGILAPRRNKITNVQLLIKE
jgi:hypothetical protein